MKQLCEKLARDPLLVQGAGGNVSWKEGNSLFIKASGTCLSDVSIKEIFVELDLRFLEENIRKKNFGVNPQLKHESALRPSIETLFHAMLPQKYVVHLHAVEILTILVQKDARYILNEMLDKDINWIMVDYFKPGLELAVKIYEALSIASQPSIVFLKNHGVIIASDTIDELEENLFNLLKYFNNPPRYCHSFQILEPVYFIQDKIYKALEMHKLHYMVFNERLFSLLKNNWALYPDHIVFLGAKVYAYDSIEKFKSDKCFPDLVFIKNTGIYSLGNFSLTKLQQLECYYHLLIRLKDDVDLDVLSMQQIEELLNWEAEKYRVILQS